MNQLLQGQPLTIFGDGEQTRAFSYIDDVAPVIARSVLTPAAYSETFNVGGDQPYTVNELARTVARCDERPTRCRHLPARKEVKDAYASHEKAARFFGRSGSMPLEIGVGRMAAWVKQVGSRQTKDFANIEVPIGLPQGW